MRFELKRLQRELGLTAIYVTHDQAEALAMSSRIAVVNEGKIVQLGKPREIYERPASEFVATFVGVTNLLRGTVAAVDAADGSCRVDTPDMSIWGVLTGSPLQVGDDAAVSIRPECVQLDADADGGRADGSSHARNEFSGEVSTRAFLGDSVDHMIAVGKQEIRNRSNPAQSIAPGKRVVLRVDHTRVAVVPAADQKKAAADAAVSETAGDAG
jgi:iron(III) transport system ATP-binding protein